VVVTFVVLVVTEVVVVVPVVVLVELVVTLVVVVVVFVVVDVKVVVVWFVVVVVALLVVVVFVDVTVAVVLVVVEFVVVAVMVVVEFVVVAVTVVVEVEFVVLFMLMGSSAPRRREEASHSSLAFKAGEMHSKSPGDATSEDESPMLDGSEHGEPPTWMVAQGKPIRPSPSRARGVPPAIDPSGEDTLETLSSYVTFGEEAGSAMP
jgi:hypothetical protein